NKKDELGVKQPQGAVVVLNPKTGEILSMVGGRDYSETQFNRTLALRKPGSSFKIFDYTPAIENGVVTPATILSSEYINVDGWTPKEWTVGYLGKLTVRDALIYSSNICAVKTGLRVGLDRVVYYAKKMGIRTPLEPYPSMTIGGFEVTPLDMAVAYGVLSNMGERVDATGVLKIIGKDGRVVYENKTNPVRVVSPEASYVMTDIFKDVLYYYFPQFKNLPIACKSGTSGDFTSAWFIGYTNDYVVSCYVGSDKELIGLEGVYNWGSRFAGQIWKNVIQELIKIKKPVDWEKPEKVVYRSFCSKTGLLKNSYCKATRYDLFISNINVPLCSYHREYKVYVYKGNENLLADESCSEELKKLKIFYDPDDIPKNYYNPEQLSTEIKLIVPSSVFVENPVVLEVQTDFKIGDTLEFDINGEKTFVSSPPLKMMWYPEKLGKYYISVYLWSYDGMLKGKAGKEIVVIEKIENCEIIINPSKPKINDRVKISLKNAPKNSFSVIVFINDEMEGVLLEEPYNYVFEVNKKGEYKITYKIYDLYGEPILTLNKEFVVN
ncbi:hypothetical protein GX420_00440, partial [bacterium]|nr:hypothetical protein [bacterium]